MLVSTGSDVKGSAPITSQTDDLELKKLVYLYLINYAKTQPDLAIMGVNTFVKVSVSLEGRATPLGHVNVHA